MYYFSGLRSVYHGYVSGIISLQVTHDGIPQLVINSNVPLRNGTAVHVLFCFLPTRRFYCSLLCDRGLDFTKENELANVRTSSSTVVVTLP